VRQVDFKQDPEGHRTRSAMKALIEEFAGDPQLIPVSISSTVRIGPYEFDAGSFTELVLYLWRGGMPGWRDGIRPPYVIDMIERIRASSAPSHAPRRCAPTPVRSRSAYHTAAGTVPRRPAHGRCATLR
jgi:hypothetical protein